MADNNVNMKVTIDANASSFEDQLQRCRTITQDMVNDFNAMNEAMDTLDGKLEKLASFFSKNVTMVGQMKDLMAVITQYTQTEQSMLTQNVQLMNDLMSKTVGHGGTVQDAMNAFYGAQPGSMRGVFGGVNTGPVNWASAAGVGDFANSPTQKNDHQVHHVPDVGQNVPQRKKLFSWGRPEKAPARRSETIFDDPTATSADRAATLADDLLVSEELKRSNLAGAAAKGRVKLEESGGLDYQRKLTSMGIDTTSLDMGAFSSRQRTLRAIASNPDLEGFADKVSADHPERAGTQAVDYMYRNMNSIFGKSPAGKAANALARRYMAGKGITKQKLQEEFNSLYGQATPDGGIYGITEPAMPYSIDPTTGERVYEIDSANYKAVQMASRMGNMQKSFMEGRLGKLASRAGSMYSGYQLARSVMSIPQQYIGMAQQMGNNFGTVDYDRSAGNYGSALLRSQFGLNPYISTKDALQSQMYGAQIGYRGGALQNYMDITTGMQQHLGMTQQQAAQAIGAGTNVGVGAQQMAAGLSQVRNVASNSSFANVQSMQNAYIGGVTMGAANLGLATVSGQGGAGAVAFGNIAANFQQYGTDQQKNIAAAQGFTGQEILGSQVGQAMLASQLGTSYSNLYATTSQMGAAGAKTITADTDRMVLSMLRNAGIPIDSIKSDKDLAPYAMKLSMILPGIGITNANSPQSAVAYVMQMIASNKEYGKYATPQHGKSGNGGYLNSSAASGSTGDGGDPNSGAHRTGSSDSIANSFKSAANSSFKSAVNSFISPISSPGSTGGSPIQTAAATAQSSIPAALTLGLPGATTAAQSAFGSPTNIVVTLDPSAHGVIALKNKQQTDSTNGTLRPNSLPPRGVN